MSWFGTGWNGERSTQYLTTEQLVSTELPESIGDLAKLEIFWCNHNKLTGEFPRIFSAPSKCSTRYLTTKQLVSAELPESIGKLTKLQYLWCHNNQLTSEFPRSFLAPSKCSTRYLTLPFRMNAPILQSCRNQSES